jgi:tetratricopeptide (TPR) repeat protein/predicted Ser/Thr protein kinase
VDCLDDTQIAGYLARTLRDSDLEHVEDHLSSCDECLAVACAAADTAGGAPQQYIGRYRVIELLGEGGMGSVYVAHDPQLERDVALKLVRSDHRTRPEMHARLAREARAMARVRHPNVIAVYDAGEVDEGVYIAMELVRGETLKRWLAGKRRGWQEIVRIFVQAGRGLAAAHAAGIVHRDFKPENVLIDSAGRVAVGDFGVATMPESIEIAQTIESSGPRSTGEQLVTRTGAQLGTPRYMSPEQFRADKLDARTDQFSFGIALCEAIYGRLPFVGATIAELATAVTSAEPALPTDAAVPASVARVIARALATDRQQRHATIEALLAELEATIKPRSRRVRIAAVAAVAIALSGTALAVTLATHRAPEPSPATALPGATATATAATTGARTRVLVGTFENRTGSDELGDVVDPIVAEELIVSRQLDVYSGADIRAIEAQFHANANGDATALVGKLAESYRGPLLAVGGTLEPSGGGFLLRLVARRPSSPWPWFDRSRAAPTKDGIAAAAADLARALRFELDHVPPDAAEKPVLSSSLEAIHEYAQGQLAVVGGDLKNGARHLSHAIKLDPSFIEAQAAFGLTLDNLMLKSQAIEVFERAAASADRLPERRRLAMLGDYYSTVGRYSEAILAYQQLLARWPDDHRTQLNLVATALDGNMWPLALDVARVAARDQHGLEIARRNLVIAELGNEHIDEAARDGSALLAELPSATSYAATTTEVADALLGHKDDAHALLAKVAAIDPQRVPFAVADLALYEGRLDDATAVLQGNTNPAAQLVLARIHARTGDRRGAVEAARIAMREDSMPSAYLAASVAVFAGDVAGADAKAGAWSDAPEADRRLYGSLLAGDLALAAGRSADAIAAYRAAGRIEDAWLAHERLARGELAAGNHAEAERELHWCLDHRGQGALLANPSLELLPEVALLYARSLDRRHADAKDVRAAYRVVADLAPEAQHDPWTAEARGHLPKP